MGKRNNAKSINISMNASKDGPLQILPNTTVGSGFGNTNNMTFNLNSSMGEIE
jgi:hypothetical protein